MPDYKVQHFLPAVYLREFSADPQPFNRNSRVWRIDRERCVLVTVQSQCAGDYFYSKNSAESVERMFGEMEGFYAECIRKIKAYEIPSEQQYFGLILMMFDLHIRNHAYENETSYENIEAYRFRLRGLRSRFLVGRPQHEPSDDEVLQVIRDRWRVKVLRRSGQGGFITSDNPSVWMAFGHPKPTLTVMVMPITPDLVAVAYDRRVKNVSAYETTPADNGGINHMQCRAAVDAIYASAPLLQPQQETVRAIWQDHPTRRNVTTDVGWEAAFYQFRPGGGLSFLRDAIPIF